MEMTLDQALGILYVFGKPSVEVIQTMWIQESSSVHKDIRTCQLSGSGNTHQDGF